MFRRKKKAMVVTAQVTSATQKAVSQPWCLAMVLNGRPDRKPPTEEGRRMDTNRKSSKKNSLVPALRVK